HLVHSAPSVGVRDWSDLRIAVAAGVWLASARPGDVIEVVSDDRAFDAVGDVSASLGITFRRLSFRGITGDSSRVAETTERGPAQAAGTGGHQSRRRGRSGWRDRHAPSRPEPTTPPAPPPPPPHIVRAPVEGEPHTAPHDELVTVVQDLIHNASGRVVTIDMLANALKARGFSRPPGSPRLITRLRRIKELTVSRSGAITLTEGASPAVEEHAEGEQPEEIGMTIDRPAEQVAWPVDPDEDLSVGPGNEASPSGQMAAPAAAGPGGGQQRGRRSRRGGRRHRPRGGGAGGGGAGGEGGGGAGAPGGGAGERRPPLSSGWRAPRPDCSRVDQLLAVQMFRSERGLCPRNRTSGEVRKGDRLSSRLSAVTARRSARTAAPPSVLSRELVEAGAIWPHDLGLRLLAHALQADELLDGHGEEPVGVRVVGGDHDVVVADGFHHLAERLLVGVGGDVALAEEVLAGELGDLYLRARPELLPRLVEPPEVPGQPATRALEERAAGARGAAAA